MTVYPNNPPPPCPPRKPASLYEDILKEIQPVEKLTPSRMAQHYCNRIMVLRDQIASQSEELTDWHEIAISQLESAAQWMRKASVKLREKKATQT